MKREQIIEILETWDDNGKFCKMDNNLRIAVNFEDSQNTHGNGNGDGYGYGDGKGNGYGNGDGY